MLARREPVGQLDVGVGQADSGSSISASGPSGSATSSRWRLAARIWEPAVIPSIAAVAIISTWPLMWSASQAPRTANTDPAIPQVRPTRQLTIPARL